MKEPELHDIRTAYQAARDRGLIDADDTVVIGYDRATLRDRLERVRRAFPSHFRHALAIKANPLPSLLAPALAKGFGLEAASYGELALAASLPDTPFIAWDSPAKTEAEAQTCPRKPPVLVNFDSLAELSLLPALPPGIRAGLRINPQTGPNAIAAMSVATPHSKFGEPIAHAEAIVRAFGIHPHLEALHVHGSSQSLDDTLPIRGLRAVLDLLPVINRCRAGAGVPPVRTVDIGGGCPVDYTGRSPHLIEDYAAKLLHACPELADPALDVITEFGRYYHAHAGFTFSRIAQVKTHADRQVIVHHCGANLFVRESYQPGVWPHRVALLDEAGAWVKGPPKQSDLGGPLCFGGDSIGCGVALPAAKPGQWLVVRDTGANSFSLWSHHCSRPFPKVIACDSTIGPDSLCIAKPRQTIADVVAFWG
jgi:diaminopimelate decarboxylase